MLGAPTAAAPADRVAEPVSIVPLTHWAYDAMVCLVYGNFRVHGLPPPAYHHTITRYEFAVALRHMLSDAGWPTAGPQSPKLSQAPVTDLQSFQRLTREFAPELELLGIDTDRLQGDLVAIARSSAARAEAVLGTPLAQRLTVRPLWQVAPERRTLLPRWHQRGSCPTGTPPSPPRARPYRPADAALLVLDTESVSIQSVNRRLSLEER
jgi:hypothetical protein